MSFFRFGCEDSDVYTFYNTGGYWECCWCRLSRSGARGPLVDPMYKTPGELVSHLHDHQAAGHIVPDSCFVQIEAYARRKE